MADEKEVTKKRPVLDMIMRLLCVYLAARFFFDGLQYWREGELLQAGLYFSLVFAEINIIFGWHNHQSKLVRMIAWAGTLSVLIFFILSRLA